MRHASAWLLATAAILPTVCLSVALAQGPPRGPWGGPGGGPPPWGGEFRPEEMFSRVDLNGNGKLEPEEWQQSRARPLIEKAASEAHLDLAKPIPLDKLRKAMTDQMQAGGSGNSTGNSNTSKTSSGPLPNLMAFGLKDSYPP